MSPWSSGSPTDWAPLPSVPSSTLFFLPPSSPTSVLMDDHLGGRLPMEVGCLGVDGLGEGEQVLYSLAILQLPNLEAVVL